MQISPVRALLMIHLPTLGTPIAPASDARPPATSALRRRRHQRAEGQPPRSGTAPAAGRYRHVLRESTAMTRDEIEALVAKERPGWRVVDFIEVNDESGRSFEVAVESNGRQTTLLVAAGKRIVGERR
jgi:hypothetical protein